MDDDKIKVKSLKKALEKMCIRDRSRALPLSVKPHSTACSVRLEPETRVTV